MTIRTCCVYVCVCMCVCVCVSIHALSMHALRILSLSPFLKCGPGLDRLNLFASSSAEYTVRNSRSTLLGARHGRGTLTLVFLPLATFKPFISCFSSKETFAAQAW